MRISDWSADVCSSDLLVHQPLRHRGHRPTADPAEEVDEAVLGQVDAERVDPSLEAGRCLGAQAEAAARLGDSSEERRVGKEWVSTCRSGGRPDQYQTKKEN